MNVTIISVGKRHDPSFAQAIQAYQTRLAATLRIEWRLLPPSGKDGALARQAESSAILAAVKHSDTVWLLDEVGENITSTALSAKLTTLQFQGISKLVIVIGGAYGVADSVRSRANWVWSLSNLVFPHQIVRLILIEQLYRAVEINKGSGYHHA